MNCPYCSTKNAPTALVCSHCGVILRASKADRHAPKQKVKRSLVVRLVAIGVAALVGAAAAGILIHFTLHEHELQAALIGGFVGAILIYLVSGAKVLYYGNMYRLRNTAIQGKIKHALTTAEEKYTEELKKKTGSFEPRLHLGTAHLLQGEVEKSVQQFQQAVQLGASNAELYNNAGVAYARRGSLVQSVEMFERAASQNGQRHSPHANLAHAFTYAGLADETEIADRAIREVEETIRLDGQKPAHFNRHGLILTRAHRFDEATQQFQKALEVSGNSKPAQADAHNNLGLVKFSAGDRKTAAQEFQTALKLDPSHGRAQSNQGVILMLQGDADAAIDQLQLAAHLDPKSASIRNNLGYLLCHNNSVNDGIREFREAILIDPTSFEPYYNLGKVYADENLPDFAERYLVRALKANPRCWQAMVTMGVVKMKQTQYPQAVQYFEEAAKIAPSEAIVSCDLGLCVAHTFDYREAEKHLRRAIELNPKDPEYYANLAWLHIQEDQSSLGAEELSVALQMDEKNPIYNNNYGLCQIFQGGYDIALTHFRRALSLDPDLTKAHYHIGYVYALTKKLNDAMNEWEKTAKVEPGFADCYVNLGVAYYQKGMLDEAVNEFRRVIVIRQNRMEDFSNLGLAYAKQGVAIRKASRNPQDAKAKEAIEKQKVAVDMFDRALALEPNNVMLHSNRGLACFYSNRPEEAMTEWTQVSHLDAGYAKRRGKAQQSEFDDTIVNYVGIKIRDRADSIPPRTPDFLYQLSPGYDSEDWDMIIEDPSLAEVPLLAQQSQYLQRNLQALQLG